MYHFVTADLHFGHANIIEYCGRPFTALEYMEDELIRRYNERITDDDVCYILGDFCFRATRRSPQSESYLSLLNGRKVMLRGNHDKNNLVKSIIRHAIIKFGGYKIGLTHNPYRVLAEDELLPADFILCGHVHEKWTLAQGVAHGGAPIRFLNVGVDVWGYRPVRIDEAIKRYESALRSGARFREIKAEEDDVRHDATEGSGRGVAD